MIAEIVEKEINGKENSKETRNLGDGDIRSAKEEIKSRTDRTKSKSIMDKSSPVCYNYSGKINPLFRFIFIPAVYLYIQETC